MVAEAPFPSAEKTEQQTSPTKDKALFKAVVLSLVSRDVRTVADVIAATDLPSDLVQAVLADLIQREKITLDGDRLLLDQEFEKKVSIIRTIENDQRRRAKFDKYSSNPEYQTELVAGEKFDSTQVESEAGEFNFVRNLSPHEKAYCFQNKVYMVWREGVREDEVFLTKNKIPESEVATTSFDTFTQTILKYLQELSEDPAEKKLPDLQKYILNTCYGVDSLMGWEEARSYDLSGDGEQINTFMQQMMLKGLRQFLLELAAENNIQMSDAYPLNFQSREVIPLYYDGLTYNDLRENIWDATQGEILLTHGSFSHVLSNLIQMNGLAARNYYQKFGINKYYGGEGQGTSSYTPDDVSFWFHENGSPVVSGGHGSQRAYDFPITFGIEKQKAEQLKLRLGTMDLHNEVVVRNFVPLSLITRLFVPSFKVEEVQELFKQNKIASIKVLPLRHKNSQY